MNKKQIAAQLYTLREYTKTAEELGNTLGKVKDIGYGAVQLSGIGPIDAEQVKELTERHGLAICATHMPYDRLTGDLEQVIRDHRLWDCRYVGLGSMPQSYRTSKQGYVQLAQDFSAIGQTLADAGLQFIYHNHKFEFEKFDGETGMEVLLRASDPETFHFELDTYWVQAGGASPTDWVQKVAGRMKVVHLKDMAIVSNEQVFAEIGEGNLDWPGLLQACCDTGVEWFVVEQDVCRRDPFESLAISYRALQKLAVES